MAKSKHDPPRPGPLRVREPVRTALYTLRHFGQLSLDRHRPGHRLKPAELDVALVADVEQALRCTLPDEILACYANNDGELSEYGFVLGEVVDNTEYARKRRCPNDLVAVGRHPDSHAFYCVSRDEPRHRGVQLADLDNFDGSLNWYDLGEWLAEWVAGRRMFLEQIYPSLVGWVPSPDDFAGFTPTLIGDKLV